MAEDEQGAAGGDTDIVAQFGGFGADAVTVYECAVLGFQVVQEIFSGPANNNKVPPGKCLVLDDDVGGVVTTNSQGPIPKFPTLGCCPVLVQ